MGNARAITWILLALVLTAFGHVILSYKGGINRALVSRTSLLDGTEGVTRLAIARSEKLQTELSRRASGWRLVSPFASAVDERAVMKFLDTLQTAEIEDTYGTQELLRLGRTRADFALDPARLSVTVARGDASSVTLSFGSRTPNGTGVYATVSGEDAVFVVPATAMAAVDLKTEDFRRREIFVIGPESVTSFDLKRGSGSFMRFRRDDDSWKMVQPEEVAASSEKVGRLVRDVLASVVTGFVWPTGADGESATATAALLAGYGLDPESAVTLTFKCVDGHDRQISFGKTARDGLVYALVHNAGAIVTVPASVRDAALAEASDFTDTRLFPVDPAALTRVSVTDGATSYLLAKGDGGEWRLDAPVSAATDARSVERLLARLTALRQDDLVAEKGVTVSLLTNRPSVMVSREAALGALRLEDLRSREILRVDPAQLKRFVVTQADSTVAVVYDRDRRAWNVESSGEKGVVSSEAVEALASALNPLKAEWVVKLKVSALDLRGYGLDAPRLTLAIDQANEDSVRRNVLVGDAAQGGSFATLGATDAVFVLSDETVRRLEARLISNDDIRKEQNEIR